MYEHDTIQFTEVKGGSGLPFGVASCTRERRARPSRVMNYNWNTVFLRQIPYPGKEGRRRRTSAPCGVVAPLVSSQLK